VARPPRAESCDTAPRGQRDTTLPLSSDFLVSNLRVVQSIGQQLGRVLERQRANEQQQLLLKELSHRVGNTLPVTQLHELAANAAKHGAFARKRGTLGVRWQKVGPAQDDALHLKWQEFGGSCNVKSERSGYGFTLIDATTKSLGAKVERHFLGEGILVELTIPLR